jgi:hypothetical protein
MVSMRTRGSTFDEMEADIRCEQSVEWGDRVHGVRQGGRAGGYDVANEVATNDSREGV